MLLLLLLALPLCGALLPALLGPRSRALAGWSTGALVVAALGVLGALTPAVMAGEPVAFSVPWVPAIGLTFGLHLDGLGFLFAFLSFGIGLLVVTYSHHYLPTSDNLGRFFATLLVFMGAMVGIALASNLLLMVVFWELTSLSSFLLIGYAHRKHASRQGARMALAITGGGGLALLAGVLLLGLLVPSLDLHDVLASRDRIVASPLYLPILVLFLLGAFTKSAQFPFHFWLPGAMAAPTPISAYLHSATMVKAGLFLMARMHPALANTQAWVLLVGGAGLVTLLFAAYTALFKQDLKTLLAYSTISHLGLITLLFGISTPAAVVAGLFHLMNHATFKAALFMLAGIIDKQTGTRDLGVLSGLRHKLPWLFGLTAVAAGAMAGLPLLNGFLSKEMFFAETVHFDALGPYSVVLPIAAALGGVLSVAYSLRLVRGAFFGPEAHDLPKVVKPPARWLLLPVEVLVALCILVGVAPALVAGPLLGVAVEATLQSPPPKLGLYLWHGFNLPLLMSAVALVGGVLFEGQRARIARLHVSSGLDVAAAPWFEAAVRTVVRGAGWVTDRLENRSLQRYLLLLIGAALLAGAAGLQAGAGSVSTPADPLAVGALLVLTVSALAVCRLHHQRMIAVVLLGVPGLVSALVFVRFSAPDLALTQLSVEVVTVVLLVLALYFLPQQTPLESARWRHARDIGVATAGGLGVTALAYAVMTRPPPTGLLAPYFLESSKPLGGGKNVVNVILVDFRGFDTMGEVVVFAIAALAIGAVLAGRYIEGPSVGPDERPWTRERHPLVFSILSRPLLPFALLVGFYLFMRGHNAPGGGFVAGLITGVAFIVQYMANGIKWARKRMQVPAERMIGVGMLLVLLTGLTSLALQWPFLTSTFRYVTWPVFGEFEVASALFFDLGVYLVVVGGVLMILVNIGTVGGLDETTYDTAFEERH